MIKKTGQILVSSLITPFGLMFSLTLLFIFILGAVQAALVEGFVSFYHLLKRKPRKIKTKSFSYVAPQYVGSTVKAA